VNIEPRGDSQGAGSQLLLSPFCLGVGTRIPYENLIARLCIPYVRRVVMAEIKRDLRQGEEERKRVRQILRCRRGELTTIQGGRS